jgi:hypothetical protein
MNIKKMAWVPDGSGFKTVEPHRYLIRKEDYGTWVICKYDEFGDAHEYLSPFLNVQDAMKEAQKINIAEVGEFLES